MCTVDGGLWPIMYATIAVCITWYATKRLEKGLD